jgi:hypothetical protein
VKIDVEDTRWNKAFQRAMKRACSAYEKLDEASAILANFSNSEYYFGPVAKVRKALTKLADSADALVVKLDAALDTLQERP